MVSGQTLGASNLTAHLAAVRALTASAIADCAIKLRALPTNPAAKSASDKSPRAFVISSSRLFSAGPGGASRWDVFFHDWTAQYEAVAKLLEAQNFTTARELLAGKTIELKGWGRTSLAPQVIENIKAITGDLLLVPETAR